MKLFSLPQYCVKCMQPNPTDYYRLERTVSSSGELTTYAIDVPMCHRCKKGHKFRSGILLITFFILGAAGVGLSVLLLPPNTGMFAGLIVFCGSAMLWALLHYALFEFARVSSTGETIYFHNSEYQRAFEQANPKTVESSRSNQ